MSHTALYRKYRPQTLDDVVGQSSTVTTLRSMIDTQSVPHSILLVGPRGTGKTSLARIIARSMNIDPIDIFEIDAASYRKIDDVRALRNDVLTVPVMSSHKIYILDEVHMFTKDSWNAFLKTLEEPPAHVIFIMATTEVDDVPDTIISRSTVFRLSMPDATDLQKVLNRVCLAEGYTIDDTARDLVVAYADGSYRNALVGLETVCSNTPEKNITEKIVTDSLSLPSVDTVRSLLSLIDTQNKQSIVDFLDSDSPSNPEFFVRMMIDRVRMVLAVRFGSKITIPANEKSLVTTLASNARGPINAGFLLSLINLISDMRRTGNGALMLQVFLYGLIEKW